MSNSEVIITGKVTTTTASENQDFITHIAAGTLQQRYRDVNLVDLKPQRRHFNLLYLLLEGRQDIYLGADCSSLKPNDLVIVPENMVYASRNLSECKGYFLRIKNEMLDSFLLKDHITFHDFKGEPIIHLSEDESGQIQQDFREIISEYENYSPGVCNVLRNNISKFLTDVYKIQNGFKGQIKNRSGQAEKITRRFKDLLLKYFLEKRKIENYASLMRISPKHLCDVVRHATGKTPKQIMNDVVLLEAKVLLGSSKKRITEIAKDLQFRDQAHFSHFIRRQTGCSPMELRRKLRL